MIKLGELLIDDEKTLALVEWLDQLVKQRRRDIATRNAERETEDRYSRWHERLCELAKETARTNGIVEGLSPRYAATATWEAFAACEGWLSPYDVDDHFEATDDWRETWEIAYVEEVERMKRS